MPCPLVSEDCCFKNRVAKVYSKLPICLYLSVSCVEDFSNISYPIYIKLARMIHCTLYKDLEYHWFYMLHVKGQRKENSEFLVCTRFLFLQSYQSCINGSSHNTFTCFFWGSKVTVGKSRSQKVTFL